MALHSGTAATQAAKLAVKEVAIEAVVTEAPSVLTMRTEAPSVLTMRTEAPSVLTMRTEAPSVLTMRTARVSAPPQRAVPQTPIAWRGRLA